MNFLQICNEVVAETNVTGSPMTSVVSQSGLLSRIVRWVNQEYMALCRMEDWSFLYVDGYTFQATQGKRGYTSTELGLTDFSHWDVNKGKAFLISDGVVNERLLVPIKFEAFQEYYDYGTQQEGHPQLVFVYPDITKAGLHPLPDGLYTVTLPYWKKPTDLTANTSTPIIPEQYHDIITFKALMRYATWDDAPGLYTSARADYIRLLAEMYEKFLPVVTHQYQPVA